MNKKVLLKKLIIEAKHWSDKGVSDKEIDESFSDVLNTIRGVGESAGTGIIETLKKYIAKYIVSKFNLDPNSFMALVVENAFANLSFSDYKKVFNDCEFTSNLIAESMIDTFADQLRIKMELDSFMYTILQSTIMDQLKNVETIQDVASKLNGYICPMLDDARETLVKTIPGIDKII
jgi:hypothetical protein